MKKIMSPPSFQERSKFQRLRLYPSYALFLFVTILISGCATLRPAEQPLSAHLKERDDAGECARFFKALDQAVEEAGVSDRQDNRISGFPYLRVNRFLASYSDDHLEKKQALTVWVTRLQALDRQARKAEISNLPLSLSEELHGPGGKTNLQQSVASCGELLREADLNSTENRQRLSGRARVPPNYSTTKSIIGLYPLSSLFVRLGIAHYHHSIEETYQTELARLPVSGHLVRYLPPAGVPPAAEARSIVEGAIVDPLGIPELKPEDQKRLFLAFAPIWEIDVSGDFDRPGTPSWADGPQPTVDPTHPRVFTLLSHTRYRGQVLLQLNYVIWFSERPLQGMLDLFGGRLDGLIWRVTLNRHGTPLIYDTIHNCGCYHMFFPGPELTARQQRAFFSEPLLVPQRAPELTGKRRLVIRVASRTHYIDRIYAGEEKVGEQTATTYDLADYSALRSLPSEDGGHRSLFGPDALVPGTERGERWLLWPTGVSSPGAMRQWGNHATAFFGRRHFDDPDLLERFFEPATPFF